MAEFLIYRGPNWMDELSASDLARWLTESPYNQAKYDARYRPGDVVEVYRNGRCTEKPSPGCKYYLMRCPEMPLKDAAALADTKFDTDGVTMLRKTKSQVRLNDLSSGTSTGLDSNGEVTITRTELDSTLTNHAAIATGP